MPGQKYYSQQKAQMKGGLNDFQVQNWQQKINAGDGVEVLEYQNAADIQSKISFEEEIYDEEFESELKHFQSKLQPKKECSLERIYCHQQLTRNGSRRKLVPNVSLEWISKLKLYNQHKGYTKSFDQRVKKSK